MGEGRCTYRYIHTQVPSGHHWSHAPFVHFPAKTSQDSQPSTLGTSRGAVTFVVYTHTVAAYFRYYPRENPSGGGWLVGSPARVCVLAFP